MLIIRPITQDDLGSLMDLLVHAGHGLTSLPLDEEVLIPRIIQSERSFDFAENNKPGGEQYLFVMEDLFKSKLIGVSGIISKIGGFDPYYFYKLEKQIRNSRTLGVENTVTAMHVHKIFSGPAEICSLFLSPEYRNSQNGRFLSLTRFQFIANHLNLFEKEIIAEMRGQVDKDGNSPFWEAVGKKFFKIPFVQADSLTMKDKSFIEDLMPNHPIIKDLLPEEAQTVVGEVHENTKPALRILQQEGFEISDLVGIFEPGPIVKAQVEEIRTIKKSKIAKIALLSEEFESEERFIISNLEKHKFFSVLGQISILNNSEIAINNLCASTLGLNVGDEVRYVNLKG